MLQISVTLYLLGIPRLHRGEPLVEVLEKPAEDLAVLRSFKGFGSDGGAVGSKHTVHANKADVLWRVMRFQLRPQSDRDGELAEREEEGKRAHLDTRRGSRGEEEPVGTKGLVLLFHSKLESRKRLLCKWWERQRER